MSFRRRILVDITSVIDAKLTSEFSTSKQHLRLLNVVSTSKMLTSGHVYKYNIVILSEFSTFFWMLFPVQKLDVVSTSKFFTCMFV